MSQVIAIDIGLKNLAVCLYDFEEKLILQHFVICLYEGSVNKPIEWTIVNETLYNEIEKWREFIDNKKIKGIFIERQLNFNSKATQLAATLFGMLTFASKQWWGEIEIQYISSVNILRRNCTIPTPDWQSLNYTGDYMRRKQESIRRMDGFIESGIVKYGEKPEHAPKKRDDLADAFLLAVAASNQFFK